MDLQAWAEWVAKIDSLTNGGHVVLLAGPDNGMTIAVQWEHDGQLMRYTHAPAMVEMKAMYKVVQPCVLACVLEQITNKVRRMT